MEIHTRYYSPQSNVEIRTFSDQSDKMFELIRSNRMRDLLEMFQSTPRDQLYKLVNEPNPKHNSILPTNFAIKCSASHLILIMLLRLGARFDFASTASTPSPLFSAVRSGQMNLVKLLILSGADINDLDEEGYSVLHWACFRNNTLMIRLILKMTNFSYHNHDRNTKRITPLGISIERNNIEMVKELMKCPQVDPNVIDSKSHRYLYDLAAESDQYHTCLELESAFKRQNATKYTSKRAFKRNFHDLHEYTVEAVIQHQLRSQWFTFANDPRGPFQPLNDPTLRLPILPNYDDWKVIKEDGSIDPHEGWTYSFLCDEKSDNPLIINFSGSKVVESKGIFNHIDNYRYRLLARIHKNKNTSI